jgi:hypothetical protein
MLLDRLLRNIAQTLATAINERDEPFAELSSY